MQVFKEAKSKKRIAVKRVMKKRKVELGRIEKM
jgi:hypothetical protein